MGGDPITTEPPMLKVDEEVRDILEKAGLLSFFRKFSGFSESIYIQVVETWEDGKVAVNGLAFTISDQLITEVSIFPLEGEFDIARESLSKLWDRVVIQVMKYFTLEELKEEEDNLRKEISKVLRKGSDAQSLKHKPPPQVREWKSLCPKTFPEGVHHWNLGDLYYLGEIKMGGDPITIEPPILKVDEEVRDILEKAGLISFFRKFYGFSKNISIQVTETWEDGKVVVNGLTFTISDQLITKVSSLPLEGEFSIARESLSKLWDRVVIQFSKDKGGASGRLTRGGFPRSSGTPVSRAQLCLGGVPLGKDSMSHVSTPTSNTSPPPQVLASSLAKCSRRSSRLQQKSEEKHKRVDYMDFSEEDKGEIDEGKDTETGKGVEESVPKNLPRRGMPLEP
eukprot:Gb_35992 [translate_table: standard]